MHVNVLGFGCGGGATRARTLHNKSEPGVLGFCVSTPAGGLYTYHGHGRRGRRR